MKLKIKFQGISRTIKKQTECFGFFSDIYTSTKPGYLNTAPFEITSDQSSFIQGTCHIELFPHCSPVS